MKPFILNNQQSKIQFKFETVDSYLIINSISATHPEMYKLDPLWSEIISKLYLEIELKYIIAKSENFVDERIKSFPIKIIVDLNQFQPKFSIDKIINTELISIGSTRDKFYNELNIKLCGIENSEKVPELEIFCNDYLMKN